MRLHVKVERWPFKNAFRVTGYIWEQLEVLSVQLESDGRIGQGEAAGVYYKNDTPARMLEQIEAIRASIEAGITREDLRELLPPSGARNVLDSALWDLEAKLSGSPAWKAAGLTAPKPLLTTMTCGADTPEKMAAAAVAYTAARAIKIKLTGEQADGERVRAIREARPDVWLGIDHNQGSTRASLEKLMLTLIEAQVQLIEQPFPIGQEFLLDGFQSPIPIAADESVQSLTDVPGLVGRFQVINIKLDKCGGLTEGLQMARRARDLGLETMVGNMMGTSLAMAPAYLIGQLCKVVDLDGPIFLKTDRPITVQYTGGCITCPDELWGNSAGSE